MNSCSICGITIAIGSMCDQCSREEYNNYDWEDDE